MSPQRCGLATGIVHLCWANGGVCVRGLRDIEASGECSITSAGEEDTSGLGIVGEVVE